MKGVQPESLNDGEAGYIRERVKECSEVINRELSTARALDPKRIREFRRDLEEIQYFFEGIFSPDTEKTFPSLKEAHETFDQLTVIVSLDEKCPGLRHALSDMSNIVDSFLENRDKPGLKFFPEKYQFVGMARDDESDREEQVRQAIKKLEEFEEQVENLVAQSMGRFTKQERDWMKLELSTLSKSIPTLYQEISLEKEEDVPQVFRFIDDLLPTRTEIKTDTLVDRQIKEVESALLDADEFQFVENEEKLRVGFHEFDPLLNSYELEEIGRFCRAHEESLLKKLLAEKPFGGTRSVYLKKEETELSRTIQVLLPEGSKSMSDLNLVVQLKHHASGEEVSDYPVIGHRGYRAAQHSLLIPFAKISRSGHVDEQDVFHTTTLTPQAQSMGRLKQIYAQADSYTQGEEPPSQVLRRGYETLSREVKFHNQFAGPGVLPIYGSGTYSGTFSREGGEVASIQKMNMVTPFCPADLTSPDKSTLTLEEKKRIADDLISGIIRIHEGGYQHQQLRPENMLIYRDEEGVKGYLTGFEFTTEWGMASRGLPLYLPTHSRNHTPKRMTKYADLYATGLIMLGLLTDKTIYSPSQVVLKSVLNARDETRHQLENPDALEFAAEEAGLSTDEYRKSLRNTLRLVEEIWTIPSGQELERLLHDDELARMNPLLHSFVKTFFPNYSGSGDDLAEEHCSVLFSSETYDPDVDYTIPLLENLQRHIASIESEEDIQLDDLMTHDIGL